MIGEIVISVVTLLVIAILVLWLIMQPQKRVLQIAVPVCILSFAVIYVFYLVAFLVPDDPVFGIPIAFQAFIETFLSFTEGAAYGDIVESQMLDGVIGTFWFETAFWALHMIVIITLAISGFAVFGRKIMDRARLRLMSLAGRREIYHIFGNTQGALILGENLSQEEGKPFVVFYTFDYTEELREDIAAFGGALIEVDEADAAALIEETQAAYPGNVAVFEEGDHARVNGDLVSMLLARKVVHDHAPYKALGQNGGFPTRPYEAFIIGFGELGKACAKQIIGNAQLSPDCVRPKLYIIDRDPIEFECFQIENPLLNEYADIDYFPADVYSFKFEKYLKEVLKTAAGPDNIYVACAPVVAINSTENTSHIECNTRVVDYVKGILARTRLFSKVQLEKMFVTPCIGCTDIWTSSIILHKSLDERAIRLNGSYAFKAEEVEDLSAEEKFAKFFEVWEDPKRTSEFSKNSSRASCDFIETMVEIAGINPENPDAGTRFTAAIEADATLLDGLSRLEHERWAAFHACNGYAPMGIDELEARTKERVAAKKRNEKDLISPHNDSFTKHHACLIAWEDLPALEPFYGQYDDKIASRATTMQGRDTDNVRSIPELL